MTAILTLSNLSFLFAPFTNWLGLADTRAFVGTDFGPYQIVSGLAAVIVSTGGCRRTRLQILACDSRDPVGGIERSEGPYESAAAIGCNHRHDVHVVAKKVYTCSKHGVGLANGMQSLQHEIANGRLKG